MLDRIKRFFKEAFPPQEVRQAMLEGETVFQDSSPVAPGAQSSEFFDKRSEHLMEELVTERIHNAALQHSNNPPKAPSTINLRY